jgi:signal transduction histidine kinase
MLAAMTSPPHGKPDAAHELTSSLSALLLGLQRLRALTGDAEKDRALALIDRMEGAVRGMAALLESLRRPPGPPGDGS